MTLAVLAASSGCTDSARDTRGGSSGQSGNFGDRVDAAVDAADILVDAADVESPGHTDAGNLPADAGAPPRTDGGTSEPPAIDGDLAQGVVAYWRFDAQDLSDQSGNGHDARIATEATCDVPGLQGGACLLQPRGYLHVDSNPLPRMTETGYASAAWIRVEDLSMPKYVVGVGVTEAFAMKYAQNGVLCAIKDVNGTQPVTMTSSTVSAGAWHHVACVYDRSAETLTAYVDGVAGEALAAPSLGMLAWSDGLGIGCLAEPAACVNTNPFTSMAVDELRLWERALTAAEVARLAARP